MRRASHLTLSLPHRTLSLPRLTLSLPHRTLVRPLAARRTSRWTLCCANVRVVLHLTLLRPLAGVKDISLDPFYAPPEQRISPAQPGQYDVFSVAMTGMRCKPPLLFFFFLFSFLLISKRALTWAGKQVLGNIWQFDTVLDRCESRALASDSRAHHVPVNPTKKKEERNTDISPTKVTCR